MPGSDSAIVEIRVYALHQGALGVGTAIAGKAAERPALYLAGSRRIGGLYESVRGLYEPAHRFRLLIPNQGVVQSDQCRAEGISLVPVDF